MNDEDHAGEEGAKECKVVVVRSTLTSEMALWALLPFSFLTLITVADILIGLLPAQPKKTLWSGIAGLLMCVIVIGTLFAPKELELNSEGISWRCLWWRRQYKWREIMSVHISSGMLGVPSGVRITVRQEGDSIWGRPVLFANCYDVTKQDLFDLIERRLTAIGRSAR